MSFQWSLIEFVSRVVLLTLAVPAVFLGLVAVVSPRQFERLSLVANRSVDTNRFFAVLERPFFIDSFVLRHCRWFGLAVLVAAAFLIAGLIGVSGRDIGP